jgi:hypothetical protein
MSSEETERASPQWGSHSRWAKGLWALGGPTVSTVVGHRTGHKAVARMWVEAVVKPEEKGAHVLQHLSFFFILGRSTEERPRLQTGPRETRPSGIIGGPRETSPRWE